LKGVEGRVREDQKAGQIGGNEKIFRVLLHWKGVHLRKMCDGIFSKRLETGVRNGNRGSVVEAGPGSRDKD